VRHDHRGSYLADTTYPEVRKPGKLDEGTAAQVSGNNGNKNNKKKKAGGNNKLLTGASIAAVAAAARGRGPRGDKHPHQASSNDDGGTQCQIHNSTHHSAGECWEIKKVMEQFHEKHQ
jgi:hypothetical protein